MSPIFFFFFFFFLRSRPFSHLSSFLNRILIGGSYFFRSGFFFLVFGDISVVFYWRVHHIEGGQWAGHQGTP
ncbi:hypothetical protein FQN60_018357 [Etheostoma spectabile]|uniref:Uncharacterized protein n=1 Tax=Etheostoma spectabile TaxID=54343 RepID=A0A5J5DHU0_9PERO|nr:hypothetical protein FQN60_018357 [Etheostoma spectabile]